MGRRVGVPAEARGGSRHVSPAACRDREWQYVYEWRCLQKAPGRGRLVTAVVCRGQTGTGHVSADACSSQSGAVLYECPTCTGQHGTVGM